MDAGPDHGADLLSRALYAIQAWSNNPRCTTSPLAGIVSASSASAPGSEPGTCLRAWLPQAAGRRGPCPIRSPGSIRSVTPSRPAIRAARRQVRVATRVRRRNSMRLAFGLFGNTGMRQAAERFALRIGQVHGASKPGTRRRYELVVGAANASRAGACFSRPPI